MVTMRAPGGETAQQSRWFLAVLIAVALYLCYLLARPFITPLVFASVLAIVFYPLHGWVERRLRRRTLSALLSTLLVVLVTVVPGTLVTLTVTRELRELYTMLEARSAAEGGVLLYLLHAAERAVAALSRHTGFSEVNLRAALQERLQAASSFLLQRTADIITNLGALVFNFVLTFFTLFFLFREGHAIRQWLDRSTPLEPWRMEHLLRVAAESIKANVYGGLAVGLVQGTLVAIGFAILGLASPILWGLVASVLSLLPLVGCTILWLPTALVLMLLGQWGKGLFLLIWGAALISMVDNIIRPYVISGRVKLHTLLVFFAVFGGIRAFGVIGIFVGPVLLGVTEALLGMAREQFERRQPAPQPPLT